MPLPQLILKTTPPRLPRTAVVRRALARRWEGLQDHTAILMTAPRGFGKTTQLAQWRRAWLERGALVAWLTLDAQDTPVRFAEALLTALHSAAGREGPAALRAQFGAIENGREAEALTALLAEITYLASLTVIALDGADRLPAATLTDGVAYLLYNAPPNLRLAIGTGGELPLSVTELAASGELVRIGVDDLRLTLDDTVDVLQRKFGDRVTLDDCARLRELTEGWPLGLQMAAATVERASQLSVAIASLSARGGDIERYFLELLLSHMSPEQARMLVRCSILESMTPELCAAVMDDPAASLHLEQLMRDTPILTVGEGHRWTRLQALAQDVLLGQFEALPPGERRQFHARAARWYAEHGHLREAAQHALDGGDEATANGYATLCLRDIAREGRLAEARDWARRLPASAFERDVYLRLSAAWVDALGESADEVYSKVDPIASDARAEPLARFEAALIGAAAATFCDEPGRIADYLTPWDAPPPGATLLHTMALANSWSLFDLYGGATKQVRARAEAARHGRGDDGSMLLACAYSNVAVGLSYMWEGRPAQADEVLQPALDEAEWHTGRRSSIAAMLAGVLAAAAFERDQPARARALLANRLDVIDRVGTPDTILLAYRTLADLARADNNERRALDVLTALHELGEKRRIVRMTVASLAEQVFIHALGRRTETALALQFQLESVVARFELPALRPHRPFAQLKASIARAYVALSNYDNAGAERALKQAGLLADELNRGRDRITLMALNAVLMHRSGDRSARDRLAEARDLAGIHGLERLIGEIHPDTGKILQEDAAPLASPIARPAHTAREQGPVAVSGGLLTVKETEVLRLLATGLSNKSIARSMDVGEETVKWHLRNVFSKLDAVSRRHAVDRARLLGLLS